MQAITVKDIFQIDLKTKNRLLPTNKLIYEYVAVL